MHSQYVFTHSLGSEKRKFTNLFTAGEVMLWDLSREDDLVVASSGIDDDSHQEPVSKVYWITDSKGKKIYVRTNTNDLLKLK